MNISMDLYTAWHALCGDVGLPLEINEIAPNMLIHRVAVGDPPIQSPDGPVRSVTMAYCFEDYENEFPN